MSIFSFEICLITSASGFESVNFPMLILMAISQRLAMLTKILFCELEIIRQRFGESELLPSRN
jgi:hypothetical protein